MSHTFFYKHSKQRDMVREHFQYPVFEIRGANQHTLIRTLLLHIDSKDFKSLCSTVPTMKTLSF